MDAHSILQPSEVKTAACGAPGGWSAPLASGSAVEADAFLPTPPRPDIQRRPPPLQ